MTTYRERREARAERLRGWADKRETAAEAVLAAGEPYRGDIAFATQPGHFPLRARVIAREHRAHESLGKARDMRSRADGIEAAADAAIYSDDVDAVDRLRERIAELEAERERVKAYNRSCRRGAPDLELLDGNQRRQIAGAIEVWGELQCKGGAFPGYHLSNLSGNISRQRRRLAQLMARS